MLAIGFNGINLAATKADLLDRGLIIQTETIPNGNRRRRKAIWNKFYSIRPQLLVLHSGYSCKSPKVEERQPKFRAHKRIA